MILYNGYLPGNKHAPRLARNIEDIYKEVSGTDIPEDKKYLILIVSGDVTTEENCGFDIPAIKYKFR
jgi:hypothetical protein